MRRILVFTVIVAAISLGDAYSKYGRSCKDIGCSRNEVCIMQEDPCTVYSRNECGKYPTCKKISQAAATCTNYVCPPTKMCRVDRGEPKCVDDPAAAINRENKQTVQSYNPGAPGGDSPSAPVFPPQVNYPQNPGSNSGYPQNPGYNPNYPQNPANPPNSNYPQNPGVYPQLSPGGTTSRPNVYQPGQNVGGRGYQGGVIGSGYPGNSGYPGQGNAYPGQANPGQQYPGYNNPQGGGYPRQGSGYPTQGGGYPNQGGGYSNQGGGYYNQNRYGQKSGQSSNTLVDRITDTLKTIGLFWFLLKFMVSRVNGIYS